MAIDYPQFRPTLSAADMGVFDIGNAIKSGLQNYNTFQEARFKPANLREALLNAQQTNQINAPYAEHAQDVYGLEMQQKHATLNNLLQQMQAKRQELQQQQFLNNLISGGNATQPSNNLSFPSTGSGVQGQPGHMTPQGFEGSLTGIPAEDYYANTGPDRKAEQEAVDRIDRANAAQGMNVSSMTTAPIPQISLPQGQISQKPTLTQNIQQGLQNTQNERVMQEGNPAFAHLNEIWEKYPQFRKELEKRGIKKTEDVKVDPKTGATSITTHLPNGEIRVKTVGGIVGVGNTATNTTKTQYQNSQMANAAREYLAQNVKNPYRGLGSTLSLAYDRTAAILGDKDAENRLIQAALFSKTLPENAIFQLQSQNSKPTVHAINAQKEALSQGSPITEDWFINNLPQETLEKVNKAYNELIGNIKNIQQQTFDQGFQSNPKNAATTEPPKIKYIPTPAEAKAELARRRAKGNQ